MKKLLYYPNFFVEDEKWLKFSLLYLDELVTIVPMEAQDHLSDVHNLVLKETELLNSHSPDEEEITRATINMGNELERITKNPITKYMLNPNPYNFKDWKVEGNFTNEIFDGKIPYELQEMLVSERYGKRSENGIKVHYEIANIYMTLLAHSIATGRGISTITDIKESEHFMSIDEIMKKDRREVERYRTLIDNIYIELPQTIDDLKIEELIAFRNKDKNKKNLEEFHHAIEKLKILSIERISENEMIDIKKEIFDAKRKYIGEITLQFGAGVGTVIGMHQLISGDFQQLEFLREILGMSAVSGIKSVYGNIGEYRNYNRAANYITDIRNLKGVSGMKS
ncbi:hypothetical protein NM897_09650 [Planococcus maritimus]|uniref:hypothetical protein n=1 Tax=Planococcus maritimus TaxID=192421 RepID=UPI00313A3B79